MYLAPERDTPIVTPLAPKTFMPFDIHCSMACLLCSDSLLLTTHGIVLL